MFTQAVCLRPGRGQLNDDGVLHAAYWIWQCRAVSLQLRSANLLAAARIRRIGDADLAIIARCIGGALVSKSKTDTTLASSAAFLALSHRARHGSIFACPATCGAESVTTKCDRPPACLVLFGCHSA